MDTNERRGLMRKLAELTAILKEREASIPIHSIRPHQLIAIEELEDEIEAIKRRLEET